MIGLILGLAAPANATTLLDYWSYDRYRNGSSMVGVDGWEGGYAADYWYGYVSGETRAVYPTTDHNSTDAPGDWGEGGAKDNWLVNTEVDARDVALQVPIYIEDNDTIGVVCRFVDSTDYYIFLMVGLGASSPVDIGGDVSALVKVQDGVATVIQDELQNTYQKLPKA